MVWAAEVPWFQEANAYWVLLPVTCVPAMMEWLLPGIQCMRQGERQATLSTVNVRPAGRDWMVVVVVVGTAWKLGVTVTGAVRVRLWGVVTPLRGALNPVN